MLRSKLLSWILQKLCSHTRKCLLRMCVCVCLGCALGQGQVGEGNDTRDAMCVCVFVCGLLRHWRGG